MLTMLKNWKGAVEINGVTYDSAEAAISAFKPVDGQIHIVLSSRAVNRKIEANTSVNKPVQQVAENPCAGELKIFVKKYMTQKACPEFDFMAKWNNDNPMPFRIMVGTIEKETKGMIYMKLRADIYAEQICTCMKCGRELTNPVSQYFGVGPECGGHNYVNPFSSDEELKAAVAEYRKKLQNITWEGWVIKSAIISQERL